MLFPLSIRVAVGDTAIFLVRYIIGTMGQHFSQTRLASNNFGWMIDEVLVAVQ